MENSSKQSYTFSKCWQRKIDGKNLVIAEHGNFELLDEKEMKLFRTYKIENQENLFSRLEGKGIIIDKKNLDTVENFYKNRFSRFFSGIKDHVIFFPPEKDKIISEQTSRKLSKFILQSPSPMITIKFYGKNIFDRIEALKFVVREVEKLNETKSGDSHGLRKGKKAIEFEIISNLSSFDEEIMEYLFKKKIYLTTFLNGQRKMHDKIRKISGDDSYSKIAYWIKKIKSGEESEFLRPPITVVLKDTLRNPNGLVNEVVNQGFSMLHMEPPNPALIKFEEWKKVGCSANDYLKLWKSCLDKIVELNKNRFEVGDYSTNEVLKSIFNPNSLPETFCNGCCAEAAYDYLGNVFPCRNTLNSEVFILGNVNHDNYRQIFTSKSSLHFVGLASSMSSFSDLSPWHPYCSSCPGYSYWENNNVIPKVPYDFLWKIISGQIEHIFIKLCSEPDNTIFQKWSKSQYIRK